MPSEPQTDLVTITLVNELPVKQPIRGAIPIRPVRRWEIQAAKTTDDPEGGSWNKYLSFSTTNEFKASLCDQAWKVGLVLKVTYRATPYWDADLLEVERPDAD